MSERENLGLDWNGVDTGPLHLGEGEDKGSIISLSLFAQSIGLPGRRTHFARLTPELIRQRTVEVLTTLVLAVARQQPLVVIAERIRSAA